TGPSDLRLALHATATSRPRSPVRRLRHQPGRRICAWLFMRLQPPALDRPYDACATNRAVGSAPGSSCDCNLPPSIARTTLAPPTGPSDLRLALHATATSRPRSPVRRLPHQPGRRICAWLFMRLQPPALDRPY